MNSEKEYEYPWQDMEDTYVVIKGKRYSLKDVEKHVMCTVSEYADEWYAPQNIMTLQCFGETIESLYKNEKEYQEK